MASIFENNLSLINTNDVRTIGELGIEWDEAVAQEMNLYRRFQPIGLNSEPLVNYFPSKEVNGELVADVDGDNIPKNPDRWMPFYAEAGSNAPKFAGRHSLFNHTMAVGGNTKYQVALNTPLMDTPEIRKRIRENSDCSIKALVKASGEGALGVGVYQYSDFMFCKHLGEVSNNYLVTLRRFAFPAGDHINKTNMKGIKDPNGHPPEIGRLVTWLGTPGNDMASILKYEVNLPYKQMQAEVQQGGEGADASGGRLLGGILNIGNKSYQNAALRGSGGTSGVGFIQAAGGAMGFKNIPIANPPYTSAFYHQDRTKSYGGVDSISSTHYRAGASDGGMKFEQNITLTFDYELRAYDGINTRAAFLDLLGNILAVTYSNSTSYWGGTVIGTGPSQSNVFANLPIFKLGANSDFQDITNAFVESVKDIGSVFNNGKPIGGISDLFSVAKNLLGGAAKIGLGGLLNTLGRPQRQALNSLVNFAPTGLWHLTIGNPRHPIMVMGNMFLESCSIEHYGPLGIDDFPTGLKVTVTMKHVTPRDNLKIEQMYMNGDFRIYQPLDQLAIKAWRDAEEISQEKTTTDPVGTSATTDSSTPTTWKMGEGDDAVDVEQNTGSLVGISENARNRFRKYWGTDDHASIHKVSREAYLGSEKKVSELDARMREQGASNNASNQNRQRNNGNK